MIRNKRNVWNIAFSLAVFLLCGVLNAFSAERLPVINFTTLCYGLLTLLWAESIRQRIVDREVNRLLFTVSICLLSYIVTRHAGTVYFIGAERVRRYMWYFESIPITLVPLLSFFAALEMKVTDTERRRRSRAWDLLYLPEIVLSVLILTNDRHGLLYSFPDGAENWSASYKTGVLYYAAAVWMSVFMLLMIAFLIKYSHVAESVRNLWLPLIPLVISDGYFILYFSGVLERIFTRLPYDVSEIYTLFVICLWEGCITVGLISSDANYIEILAKTDVMAGIADKNGRLIYRNIRYPALPVEMLESMTEKPIMWNDDTRLMARHISGGYVVWNEDLSNINVLSARLDELRDSLQDEKLLIESQNALRERRTRAVEQGRLYQMVSESVTPQLHKLEDFLSDIDENAPDIKERIAEAGVYQAYIKRRCNLALLAANTENLPLFELQNSIHESMELLTMNGVACTVIAEGEKSISSRVALLLYDLFELVVETLLPHLTALLVNVSSNVDAVLCKLSADTNGDSDVLSDIINERYGRETSVIYDDGSYFISVVIGKGGAA